MALLDPVKESFMVALGRLYIQQYREALTTPLTHTEELKLKHIENLVKSGLLTAETKGYVACWMEEDLDLFSALVRQGQYFEGVTAHQHPWAIERCCHAVAFLAYLCDPALKIYTGFSCHMFSHSWLVTPQREIVEPTPIERSVYFGYPVEPISFGKMHQDWIEQVIQEHPDVFPSTLLEQWTAFKAMHCAHT